jgi:hypothetical protein
MTRTAKLLTLVYACGATTVLAQSSTQPATPQTPTSVKTSTQGSDSKEPAREQNTAPKSSTQGTDAQEAAKPATTAKGSFQDTDTRGDGKKAAVKKDAGM